MLQRILKLTSSIIAVASDPSLKKPAATTIKNFSYTFEEQSLVEKIVEVLEPFLKATESVSSDKVPTLHKIMPILYKIEKCISEASDNPESIKYVKAHMREELEKRTEDTELAMLACALNPFTKDLTFLRQSDAEKARELLLTTALEQNNNTLKIKQETTEEVTQDLPVLPRLPETESSVETLDHPTDQPESSLPQIEKTIIVDIDETPDGPSPKKLKMEMQDMDDWLSDVVFVKETKQPISSVIHQELARYNSAVISPEDKSLTILEWWKHHDKYYPRLSCLARKYLAIPASSVPSERIFSLCGSIVSKKRARLNPNNVSMMVFLNKNMDLFW